MKFVIVALGLFLAACTTPVVTGASRDSITIQYDPWRYDREEITARAEKHCGGKAVFVSTSKLHPLHPRHDVFYCEN